MHLLEMITWQAFYVKVNLSVGNKRTKMQSSWIFSAVWGWRCMYQQAAEAFSAMETFVCFLYGEKKIEHVNEPTRQGQLFSGEK